MTFELKQTEIFRKWRTRLKDVRAHALIAARLDRLAFGHAGDVKAVGQASASFVSHTGRAIESIFSNEEKY
jgi:putative addiction module killer protein